MKPVRTLGMFLALILLLSFSVYATPDRDEPVRNLIVVLDASRSMQGTRSIIGSDPKEYRFTAIRQFVYYLAQETDRRLGWIVFSSHVDDASDPVFIRDQNHAREIYGEIKGAADNADGRLTNIGEALKKAVEMASSGGRSAEDNRILLVSDGNTDMDDNPNIESGEDIASKKQRDEAVEKAAEKGIPIYCICLNANKDEAMGNTENGKQYAYIGDMEEMNNIADQTGGNAIELTKESDLQDEFLFNNFLEAALGLKMSDAMMGIIGPDETLDYTFTVPGLGLERVDIKVGGDVRNLSLLDPSGKPIEDEEYVTNVDSGFSFLKARGEVMNTPGTWTLRVTGDRGNRVKFQMSNRSDIEVVLDADQNAIWNEPYAVSVRLKTDSTEANSPAQYEGYRTTIQVKDEYGNVIENVPELHTGEELPLSEDGTCFRTEITFPEGFEGNYRLLAFTIPVVTIHGINESGEEEETEETPPDPFQSNAVAVQVSAPAPPVPIPVENPARKTCIRYFHFSLDFPSLFTNPEIVNRYEVLRDGLFDGPNIHAEKDDHSLTVPSFSLKEGIIVIRAYNEEGDYCDVSVWVKSTDPVPFLIGIAAVILLVFVAFLIKKSRTPFYGTIKVTVYEDGRGISPGSEQKPTTGKFRLGRFGTGTQYNGLHPGKSWFQPTGKDYVIFHANCPVRAGAGSQRGKKKVIIRDRIPVNIYVRDETKSYIKVEFTSNIPPHKQHRRKVPHSLGRGMSGPIGGVSGAKKNSPWAK